MVFFEFDLTLTIVSDLTLILCLPLIMNGNSENVNSHFQHCINVSEHVKEFF